jgi:hypothetical protein
MESRARRILVLGFCLAWAANWPQTGWAQWKPGKAPIMTRWAKDVRPELPLPDYPRPQMERKTWSNLNGLWDYAIRPKNEELPQSWDGKILVPFAAESALSGVMKPVGPENKLWYRRNFNLKRIGIADSEAWNDKQILLHFGAVDWEADVWINGKKIGTHLGGYDPFTFDISSALKPQDDEQEVVVAVRDPSDASTQPRGKQIRNPNSIWYTPITGIWQTVWLEPVNKTHVTSVKIVPDIDAGMVRFTPVIEGGIPGDIVQINVFEIGQGGVLKRTTGNETIEYSILNAKLWSPEHPFLYGYQLSVERAGKSADTITGYFAMRKISLGKNANGHARMELNNKPYFQYGPLDQGFWPDGLYTAPTDAALKYDIELTKQMGFNMARKHVKVEPDRWYYWCDRLGLLVWQDMPSGDRYISDREPDIKRTPESIQQFELEWRSMIRALENHPCIVMWVPFNEGWGQFDTARIAEMTRQLDPTRLVDSVSGWADRNVGDVHDIHVYPGPAMPPTTPRRASVLGEFGGLGLPVEGHTWQGKDNWGYRSFKTMPELQSAYLGLMHNLRPLVAKGLSAAVYTQTTDVEIEVNGLMTYDREILKFDPAVLAAAHKKLTWPVPETHVVVPTSEKAAQTWQYTTTNPVPGWERPVFDTSSWKEGPGGFGTESTPGTVVRTKWESPDIWIRRRISIPANTNGEWLLQVHHDEDTDVYLDGQLIASLKGFTTNYTTVPLDPIAARALTPGEHVLAVHTHQTGGGQYIDLGLVQQVEREQPVK